MIKLRNLIYFERIIVATASYSFDRLYEIFINTLGDRLSLQDTVAVKRPKHFLKF